MYRNILIIKPGAVGDLIQMTPVVRALNKAYPTASITLLVGSASTASLFHHHPGVREAIVYERSNRHRSLPAFLQLWKDLRSRSFDLVLNFQRSNLKAWALVAASFPCRILVYHKARKRIIHAVQNYLETLAPLGIPPAGDRLEFFLDAPSRDFAKEILPSPPSGAPVIALNPGATHAVNRWPAQRFAELADLIAERIGGQAIIIGGPDDVPLAEQIIEASRTKPRSFAGKTSLLQLGALLERCSLLVSGDTGPMHLATAVGTPVIALFGAADPDRTGPIGAANRVIAASDVDCVPCRSRSCSNKTYLACMERITPDRVAGEITQLLRQRPSA
ncbi:MAG: glycosyltransferase family 9 protein [Nitrospiraceae bacterium]|nr:glycosyltransferase family 9 protein [Nitrospiraceae bacterium]